MSWSKTGFILIVATILTRWIPFSTFFRNINTLYHELAHALAALLLKGEVLHIYLFADHSGETLTTYTTDWQLIITALSGYIGAALFAWLLFALYGKGKLRVGLIIISISAGLTLVLFVRNGYGVAWCAGFTLLTILVLVLKQRWLEQAYYLFIAFICLVESIISAGILLYISVTDASGAGDAANLSKVTGVPAIVWGLLFLAIAIWCGKKSLEQLRLGGENPSRQSFFR